MGKILGAHNANTYLRPRKWWMKLIKFTSKCQKLTINDQFKHGVRYFDLRIRYDKKLGMFINCHGLVEYYESLRITVYNLTYLAAKIAPEPIYIRFVYDDTFNNHINDYNFTDLFIKHILPIFRHDGNVIWQLIKKSSWKHIDSNNRPQPTIVDCFKNYRGYKWIPFPQRYIYKHKEHYQEIIDNTKVENDTIFLCDRVDLFKIK